MLESAEMDRFDYVVWQDREVKFDIVKCVSSPFCHPNAFSHKFNCRQHKIRAGEEIHDIFDYVEDTKGNPNDRGRLMVTSLRLIWYSTTNPKFNLCTHQ